MTAYRNVLHGPIMIALGLVVIGACSGGGGESTAGGDAGLAADGASSLCNSQTSYLGSCTFTDDGINLCNDFYGTLDLAEMQTNCEDSTGSGDGVWSVQACPPSDVPASCLVDNGNSYQTVVHFFTGGSYVDGYAEASCDALGSRPEIDTTFCGT